MRTSAARLVSGWTAVALICLGVLVIWLPDLDLPLGNSDDGRILGRFGLHARNFWELGPLDSRFGAAVEPFVRAEFDVEPRTDPPVEAVTYAHHPPLQMLITVASVGVLGDNLPALRIVAFMMGSATVAFMALLLRVRGMPWGPTLLAVLAMACTGFFYVYARIGVGYSLLVASTATVAWLREAERPSRPALIGVGVLAALTAMQSWIAMASLAPLGLWLFTGPRYRARPAGDQTEASTLTATAEPTTTTATTASAEPTTATATAITSTTAAEAAASTRWDWVTSRWSRPMTAMVIGAIAGAMITAIWMVSATDISELAERVAFRTGTDVSTATEQSNFTVGEFLARQWEFAGHELMAPPWLQWLLAPALLAGIADRRTRTATAITLAVAAVLTFAFMQGAWIHRLWNFPWLAPATIGMAALFDALRRAMRGRVARLRVPVGALAALVAVATLYGVVYGATRDFYLSDPSDAGAVLEEARDLGLEPESVWTGPGISTARWVSYYLDAPVWQLSEDRLAGLADNDLVLLRNGRVPDYVPSGSMADPIASGPSYTLLAATDLRNKP